MIFLVSSNSPYNGNVTELIQTEEGQQKATIQERAQTEQPSTDYNSSIQMESSIPTKIASIQEEQMIEEPPMSTQIQMEILNGARSLIYKTRPSSPQADTISDLDGDDIRALNETH